MSQMFFCRATLHPSPVQIKTLSLSFRSAKQLRGLAEMLPAGPQWKRQRMNTTHPTKSKVYLYYRDPVECLEALFSNPLFQGKMDFIPRRVWTTSARLVRRYSEWMTGDAAWEYQVRIPHYTTTVEPFIEICQVSSSPGGNLTRSNPFV